MKVKTRRWDVVSYLETDEEMAHYLEAALAEGDATHALSALSDVARAFGIREISKQTGIPVEELMPAFSRNDKQDAGTVMKVARFLGTKSSDIASASKMRKPIENASGSSKRAKSKAS